MILAGINSCMELQSWNEQIRTSWYDDGTHTNGSFSSSADTSTTSGRMLDEEEKDTTTNVVSNSISTPDSENSIDGATLVRVVRVVICGYLSCSIVMIPGAGCSVAFYNSAVVVVVRCRWCWRRMTSRSKYVEFMRHARTNLCQCRRIFLAQNYMKHNSLKYIF